MTAIFDILAVPLGWLLHFIYQFIPNYFVAIFLFTLLVRIITFPLSLKSQKTQAERAKLAPRLERIQKKYSQDKQKLQQKTMELYEKENVSMTGGCLPMLVQFVVLFGIISVIYKPLTHLQNIPAAVTNTAIVTVTNPVDEEGKEIPTENKITKADAAEGSYYRELRMLKVLDANKDEVIAAIDAMDADARNNISGAEYYEQMQTIRKNFDFFGQTMLDNPWNSEKGFQGISILWLIPLISGLTALASSLISMRFMKVSGGQDQPGQGCSNVMMMVLMPAFSLFITFTVPGGVGIYWICSNIIAVIQTIVLNMIYNPAKIRAQAELEYQERRRKKAEDKKRLKEARLREEQELRRQEKEEAEEAERKRQEASAKKPVEPTKNPNKLKKKAEGSQSAEEKPEAESAGEAGQAGNTQEVTEPEKEPEAGIEKEEK